jgi:hypothetical protein
VAGFAVLAEVACALLTLVLGARLLALFVTRGAPAGLLGFALVFGGAPSHVLTLAFDLAGGPPPVGPWRLASAMALIASGIAGTCVMRFTQEVFHPRNGVLTVATGLCAAFFSVVACTVPFGELPIDRAPASRASGLLLIAIFLWAAFESLRHFAMYRHNAGLDPLVVDRFRLWGVAAFAYLLIVALLLGTQGAAGTAFAGVAGLVATGALWLAFLPPRAYARRLRRRARRRPLAAPAPDDWSSSL